MEKNNVNDFKTVIIGGSAGSLDVLLYILPLLKKNLPLAIIIVLHRKLATDSPLIDLINTKTSLPVFEVEEKMLIKTGTVYIAPADYHLLIEKDKSFSLDYSEKIHFSRPSIDVCFETAADVFQENLTGILLSGANADGAEGLKLIQGFGGNAIVQDPATAEVSYMPEQAIKLGNVDFIFTPEQIVAHINTL